MSFVPLLAVNSELRSHAVGRRRPRKEIAKGGILCMILVVWVCSLLLMPSFRKPPNLMFFVGDMSLFWYVLVAPPSYGSIAFIVTAVFSTFTALLGIILIYRLSWASLLDRRIVNNQSNNELEEHEGAGTGDIFTINAVHSRQSGDYSNRRLFIKKRRRNHLLVFFFR